MTDLTEHDFEPPTDPPETDSGAADGPDIDLNTNLGDPIEDSTLSPDVPDGTQED